MARILTSHSLGPKLGNWNDRRFGHDSRSESSRLWRLLDGVARWFCLRAVDELPGCGHSDDITWDGQWCAVCDPALGGQGAAQPEDFEPINCEPWR